MNNEEKFIKLCETSDYVLVNEFHSYVGTYDKENESIVFPKFRPEYKLNVKGQRYEYDGEWWILFPKNRKDYSWKVKFLIEGRL